MDGASAPPPKGVKGALLILPWSFKIKIKIKSCPLPGLSTHLPPLRRGRDSYCRGTRKLVLSLPPLTGEAAPKGLKGALLILL